MKNGCMVSIGVRDLDESIQFYTEQLSFRLLHRVTVNPQIEFAFLLFNEEIEVQLICRKGEALPDLSSSAMTLSFQTEDVASELQRLQDAGFAIDAAIRTMPTGTKILPFTDPNGVHLSFIEE